MEQPNQKQRCPNCGDPEMKLIPAGVSKKTGKPYNSFFSCKGCGKTLQTGQKPVKTQNFAKNSPSTANLNEVLGVLGEIQGQLLTIDNKIDELSKRTKEWEDVPLDDLNAQF